MMMIAQKYRHVRVDIRRDQCPAQVAAIQITDKAQQDSLAALQKEAQQQGAEASQDPLVLETKSGSVATAVVSPL